MNLFRVTGQGLERTQVSCCPVRCTVSYCITHKTGTKPQQKLYNVHVNLKNENPQIILKFVFILFPSQTLYQNPINKICQAILECTLLILRTSELQKMANSQSVKHRPRLYTNQISSFYFLKTDYVVPQTQTVLTEQPHSVFKISGCFLQVQETVRNS